MIDVQEFIATDDKGHGYHSIVTDYKTVYHDCLVSKDWLKAHEHDLDNYEPTIEITVDGQSPFSVNGNYKQGVIKDFMSEYCKPGEGKIRIVNVKRAYAKLSREQRTMAKREVQALV